MPFSPIYDIIQEVKGINKSIKDIDKRMDNIRDYLDNSGPLFSKLYLMTYDPRHKLNKSKKSFPKFGIRKGCQPITDSDELLDFILNIRTNFPPGFTSKISASKKSYQVIKWVYSGHLPMGVQKNKATDIIPWLSGHIFQQKSIPCYLYDMYTESLDKDGDKVLKSNYGNARYRGIGEGAQISFNHFGCLKSGMPFTLPPHLLKEVKQYWNVCREYTNTPKGVDITLSLVYNQNCNVIWIRECSLFIDKNTLDYRHEKLSNIFNLNEYKYLKMWECVSIPRNIGAANRLKEIEKLFMDKGCDVVEVFPRYTNTSLVGDYKILFSMTEEVPIDKCKYKGSTHICRTPKKLLCPYAGDIVLGSNYSKAISKERLPFLAVNCNAVDEWTKVRITGVKENGYPYPNTFIESTKLTNYNPLNVEAYIGKPDIRQMEIFSKVEDDTPLKNYVRENVGRFSKGIVLDLGCGEDGGTPWEESLGLSFYKYDYRIPSTRDNLKKGYYDIILLSDVLPKMKIKTLQYKTLLLAQYMVKVKGGVYVDYTKKSRRNRYVKTTEQCMEFLKGFFEEVKLIDKENVIFKCRRTR